MKKYTHYVIIGMYLLVCMAVLLLSLAILGPALCTLLWLTSLHLSLQEYLDIAKKYGLHPVSIAIGLILLLSHSVSVDMFLYVVISFYSSSNSCKFLIENFGAV